MQKTTPTHSENLAAKSHFYCGLDSISRRTRFTVEATSLEEAQKRMAIITPLLAITKDEKFFLEALEDAPHGVPTFLKWFFALENVDPSEAVNSALECLAPTWT